MPPLRGFSDNPFRDKGDVIVATKALVQALEPYFSPGQARVRLPIYSGAHFDEVAADLEGFARPIWAIAAASTESGNATDPTLQAYAERLVSGLANGVDPGHPEYWGAIDDWDQRMVEAEAISFALLLAPKTFYEPLSAHSRSHLVEWLSGLNGKVMPKNNWRWFRIFANLALHKVCGVRYENVKEFIQEDFALLDTFQLGNGWAADGPWRKDATDGEEVYGRQADYYSGSFAIQFSQLLYTMFAADLDPERVSLYIHQARQFADQFWRYFDEDGAPIPFGRSLTYRFAMGAFYAAFALARAYDPSSPYASPGFVKGMLFRHLRWWATHSDNVFALDGTLTIGYLYPNMFMCEDYNSPQSPYWAMKSFVMLALASNDEFWQADELPHPLAAIEETKSFVSGVKLLSAPFQILCDHPDGQHHFMISGGQFCVWPLKATQAKYSKFAYSSAFGFSVPTGLLLTQIAPDSTLAISGDDGETWVTRWQTTANPTIETFPINNQDMRCLRSGWKPWRSGSIEINTLVIPPCDKWPDWHVRVHRLRNPQAGSSNTEKLRLVEGGFSIEVKQPRRTPTLTENWGATADSLDVAQGGRVESGTSCLVISNGDASGIKNLFASECSLEGKVLKPDPNTNLMTPRTLIPTIEHDIPSLPGQDIVIVNAVFAISKGKTQFNQQELMKRWYQPPRLPEEVFIL
ncbi:Uncharacterized protein conserved in bacteria DUF2264 [Aspergillus parasiticus SU-1]|uniref:Uncharacterized protein conserved in bacteria DUF2264 n=1 Tax=Aspergillus parasiticus (strain ATCC 56775 / NRRL 5862 / SRRC 143 / SU-1) TaxID=1403190 RepID=A0A0F0I3L5_ASPPU|nr:Uncharacterized protein conserved in bacteria DUF2264 [Aspergillus parasiticus SU-1]